MFSESDMFKTQMMLGDLPVYKRMKKENKKLHKKVKKLEKDNSRLQKIIFKLTKMMSHCNDNDATSVDAVKIKIEPDDSKMSISDLDDEVEIIEESNSKNENIVYEIKEEEEKKIIYTDDGETMLRHSIAQDISKKNRETYSKEDMEFWVKQKEHEEEEEEEEGKRRNRRKRRK